MDLKNVTTKSVVLAPYNSSWDDVTNEIVAQISIYTNKDKILKIKSGKLREIDKEYEANNNANMDNGVFNTEDEKSW